MIGWKCPGLFEKPCAYDGNASKMGGRCPKCRAEGKRIKARKWAQEHKEYLYEQKRTYSKHNLKWAQDVAPAPTIKTADKMISEAIKWSL